MAEFHLTVKVASRGAGKGAGGHARYILRAGPYAKKTVDVVNGTVVEMVQSDRASEVVYSSSGYMPVWAQTAENYWDAADAYERSNGTVYREVEFALPAELSASENIALAVGFAKRLAHTSAGPAPCTLAIHRSKKDPELLHCHLMLSDKVNDSVERDPALWFRRASNPGKDPARGGAPKTQERGYDKEKDEQWVDRIRPFWSELANTALEQAGVDARIDHRTLESRRLEQERLASEAIDRGDELSAARHQKAAAALDRPPQPKRGRVLEHGGPEKAPGQAALMAEFEAAKTVRAQAVEVRRLAEVEVARDRQAVEHERNRQSQEQALLMRVQGPRGPRVAFQGVDDDTEEQVYELLAEHSAIWVGRESRLELMEREAAGGGAINLLRGVPVSDLVDPVSSDRRGQFAGSDRVRSLRDARQSQGIYLTTGELQEALGKAARAQAVFARARERHGARDAFEDARIRDLWRKRQQMRMNRVLDAQALAETRNGFRTVFPESVNFRRPAWVVYRERVLTEAYGQAVGLALGRWVRVDLDRGSRTLHIHNKVMDITDYGDRLVALQAASSPDGKAQEIEAMLQIAGAKGWKALTVTGTEDFQMRAGAAALAAGFTLTDGDLAARITARQAAEAQRVKDLDALATAKRKETEADLQKRAESVGYRLESGQWSPEQRNEDPEYQRLVQEIKDDPSLKVMANTAYEQGISRARQEREVRAERQRTERTEREHAQIREGVTLQVGIGAPMGKGYNLCMAEVDAVDSFAQVMMDRRRIARSTQPFAVTFAPEVSQNQRIQIIDQLQWAGYPLSADTLAANQCARDQLWAIEEAARRESAPQVFTALVQSIKSEGLAGIHSRLRGAGFYQEENGQYGHPHKDLPEYSQVLAAMTVAIEDFKHRAEDLHYRMLANQGSPKLLQALQVSPEYQKWQKEKAAEPLWLETHDKQARKNAEQRWNQEQLARQLAFEIGCDETLQSWTPDQVRRDPRFETVAVMVREHPAWAEMANQQRAEGREFASIVYDLAYKAGKDAWTPQRMDQEITRIHGAKPDWVVNHNLKFQEAVIKGLTDGDAARKAEVQARPVEQPEPPVPPQWPGPGGMSP